MKRIFSIIVDTIAFWGTLVLRILTVDHTFKDGLNQIQINFALNSSIQWDP